MQWLLSLHWLLLVAGAVYCHFIYSHQRALVWHQTSTTTCCSTTCLTPSPHPLHHSGAQHVRPDHWPGHWPDHWPSCDLPTDHGRTWSSMPAGRPEQKPWSQEKHRLRFQNLHCRWEGLISGPEGGAAWTTRATKTQAGIWSSPQDQDQDQPLQAPTDCPDSSTIIHILTLQQGSS